MPRMISISDHVFAGRRLSVGDEFDSEDKFVPVLLRLGRARIVDGYQTEEMLAAPRVEYLTRDMQARKRGRPRKSA